MLSHLHVIDGLWHLGDGTESHSFLTSRIIRQFVVPYVQNELRTVAEAATSGNNAGHP